MPADGRHHRTGLPVRVSAAGGVVTGVEPIAERPGLPTLAPAFFDPQINGARGDDFATPDGAFRVAEACRAHGVAAFAPTVITAAEPDVRGAFAALSRARAASAELARRTPLFHLEGPYISPDDGPRGAHPKAHVRPPDAGEFDRWQEAAGGCIGLVTLAPELPGALPFIEKLVKANVVVAIGHTAATAAQIADAASAGATVSTHLGNGVAATLPRHDNPIWAQLADDRLTAGVIADGDHLPAHVFECFRRVKTVSRLFVTCDASPLAGLPPGAYPRWGGDFEVTPAGKVVAPGTPYLAGSGHFTDHCFEVLVNRFGVSVADALLLATVNARRVLGLPVPTLDAGQPADLVAIHDTPEGVRVRPVIWP